jgi:hypothetical protein
MTTKSKTKSKAPTKSEPAPKQGYAGHKVGSRKSIIHELFDREGEETAWTRGIKMGLQQSSLRTWIGHWRRSAKPATAKKKAVKSKPTAKVKTNSAAAPTTKPEAATAAA